MGKKNTKPEMAAGNETVSFQSDIFKTIFGEISEQNAEQNAPGSSLFSDSNPFRRKPIETIENPEKVDSLDSDTVELKHMKRKEKEKAKNPSLCSIEEVTGTQKGNKANTLESPNLGSLSSNVESSDFDVKSEEKKETSESPKGQDMKRKKRKRDEVEKEYEERKYGTVAMAAAAEKVVVGQKRKKAEDDGVVVASVPKEGFDDESKLLRTVFVGNLPIKVKKKVLIKEFSKFGEIESVRIRSVPLNDTKKPRKGAIMLKQINEKADSVHAYIVFKAEQSAEASLAHNMAVVSGNHIRVDRACPPRKKLKGESSPLYDNKRTVFVGNLPFDVKDEEIYQLFCCISNLESSIEAVRVVRDPQFGVGKGIAYVLLKTREAANMVVKKGTLKLKDRELRLSHARPDATPSKRKNPISSGTNSTPAKKFAVDSSTPSTNGSRSNTKACLSYQGLHASKSGVQKKVRSKGTGSSPVKMKFKAQKGEKPKERTTKRPAVAARKAKAKAHKDAGVPKQAGVKRKLDSLSPGSAHQKKKAKRFR